MSAQASHFYRLPRQLLVVVLALGLGAQLFAQVADDPVTVPVQFQGLYDTAAGTSSGNPASVNLSPNGTNYASGSSNGGTDQLTSNGVARLRPGRTYLFTINTYYLIRLRVKITAPAGYRVFINTVEHEMFDWQMGNPLQHLDAVGNFSVRLDDGSGASVGEAASLRPGRVLWSVGLGNLRNGKPAGSIVMAENGLTANTYKPDALYYDRDGTAANSVGDEGEVETIKVGNTLRQVYAQTALVDVVTESDHAYYLRFYPRDTGQIGAKVSGIYPVSGTPIYEFRIENPTYPLLDALRITKTTNQGGQLTTWTEMRKQVGQPAGQNQWVIHDWNSNAVGTTSPVQHWWTYTDSDRSELMEVRESNGTTVVHKVLKLYSDLNFGTETSRELTSETVGEPPTAVTTTYSYYTDQNSPGDWRRMRSITSTDGSWTAFNYSNDFFSRGQIQEVRRPHKNSPSSDPGIGATLGERTTYTYGFRDGFETNILPTQIETAINNVVTGRTQIDYSYETITDQSADYSAGFSPDMTLTVASRRDYFNATQFLTTITKLYREDADDQYRFFPGLSYSVQKPDKTMTVNAYFHTAFVGFGYTLLRAGEGRETLTVNGTSDTSVGIAPSYSLTQPLPSNFRVVAGKSSSTAIFYGGNGVMTIGEKSVYASDGQWVTTQQDWPTYTDSFYPLQVARRTSYAGGTWLVANNTWTQGRLSASIDETGVRQTLAYDTAGRVETMTRDAASALSPTITIAALTTTNAYDAAGRITTQTVASPGYFDSLVSFKTYDKAGRILTETSPGAGATSYAYDPPNRMVTATLPTGSTRVETTYLDGRPASASGSAAVAENYDYTIDSGGLNHSKVTLPASTAGRRKEVWTDWLGRTTRNLKPGFVGQPDFEENQFYDLTSGRPQKTTRPNSAILGVTLADTYYEYNSMGETVRTGTDVSGGGLQLNSTDRIADTDTAIESFDGADYWLTSRTWAYPVAGDSSTRKLMGTVRKRLTGLSASLCAESSSIDAEGNETRQAVTVDSTNKLITSTTTRPGLATVQTDVALNGLLISSTGHDGLTYKRAYDPLTRPITATDPRSGTITTVYWPGTTLPKETTDAASKRLSYTEYDGAGRPILSKDALENTTRVAYNARSQIEYQWGSSSYPVSYIYDSLGQRTKQRTYQSGNSSTWESPNWPGGSASFSETEWEFDDQSGLLKKKYDPSRYFVEYTYNNRGQTSQRFWSRTVAGQRVSASYGYDAATGELTSIGYNDSTPNVSYTYNRLGQTSTVNDFTGARTFAYNPASPWRLATENLSAFYGSRVLTRSYESNTNAGSGTVRGRYNGYRLGTVGTPSADSVLIYTTSNIGRLTGLVSSLNNGASSRQFVYGYEANSALLKTLSVVANAFYVERGFEANRDLLTRIESRWSGTVRTKFEYAYDNRRQRQSVVQSGDAYADYGDSIHQIFNYNPRGELTSANTYMGADSASTTPPMKARMHEFDYDSIGNRKTSNTSGIAGLADHYTPNSLNQYSSRENNRLSLGGVADANAKVAVGSAATTQAVRAGRHWGENLAVSNGSQPFYGSIPVYSALLGQGGGGRDLLRVESKIGFLAKALQSFTYDTDGNLTSDGVWDYQWDAENRLVRMSSTGPSLAAGMTNRILEFRYDYMSRRVQKRVLDGSSSALLSERRYLYDGSNLIGEFDGAAAIKRSYTWGLDLAGSLSATGGVGALAQIYNHDLAKTFFPTYDGNGNVAALVNADTGVTEAAYEYSPFGELLRTEGTYAKENPFRFSTKFIDEETGLIDYGARFYSPTLGRFINRDPIAEQGGLNLYGFCGNDGVNQTDYLGYSWFSKLWQKVKPFVAIAVSALIVWAAPFAAPFLNAVVAGAAGGAISGGAKGALYGAIGGALFYGAGSLSKALNTNWLGKGLIHGLAGGTSSSIAGGKFGSGFAAGFAAGSTSRWVDRLDYGWQQVAAAGAIGGGASVLSGGRFEDGATTGAFSRIFNDWLHDTVGGAAVDGGRRYLKSLVTAPFRLIGTALDGYRQIGQLAGEMWYEPGVGDGRRGEVAIGTMRVIGEGVVDGVVNSFTTPEGLGDLVFGIIAGSAMGRFGAASNGATKSRIWKFGNTKGALGTTDKFGNITIQSGLRGQILRETVRHEAVHRLFSPRPTSFLGELRADIGMAGYRNSSLLRFTEEAIAESYATRSLAQGLKFPFAAGYVTPAGVAMEGAAVLGSGAAAAAYFSQDN